MNEIFSKLKRLQTFGFATGVLFLVLCIVGVIFEPRAFFVSWLFAFLFWFGLSLGCLNVAMIHYLTGGKWGNVTRRFLEAGYMTLPLVAILFVPLLFGLHELYPWAQPARVAADVTLQKKVVYENFTGYLVRGVFFFGVWIFIARRLRQWSLQQDKTLDVTATIKMRTLSGPGVVITPLLGTFAFVDWVMSIEPTWYSTVFCIVLLSGQILIAVAFIIVLLVWSQPHLPFREILVEKHFIDLGSLLLAFVMFWMYVAFSQILIIYSGNEPHEISWYLHRVAGSWKWFVIFLVLFHFFAPFFVLLFRSSKKHIRRLATIAVLVFLAHALEIFWAVAPTFYPTRITVHWTDFVAWLGIGGIWLGVFAFNLKRHPLLAQNNPQAVGAVAQTVNAR
jgi:hypothetical protein